MNPAMLKFGLRYGVQEIALPVGAIPRHVHEQDHSVKLWVEADATPTNGTTHRRFQVLATGEPQLDEYAYQYLGSAHIANSGTVWHVYEVTEQASKVIEHDAS